MVGTLEQFLNFKLLTPQILFLVIIFREHLWFPIIHDVYNLKDAYFSPSDSLFEKKNSVQQNDTSTLFLLNLLGYCVLQEKNLRLIL